MLDVLEHAGLAHDVARGEELPDNRIKLFFTIDNKTGAKITGMIGKKGGGKSALLERMCEVFYNSLGKGI